MDVVISLDETAVALLNQHCVQRQVSFSLLLEGMIGTWLTLQQFRTDDGVYVVPPLRPVDGQTDPAVAAALSRLLTQIDVRVFELLREVATTQAQNAAREAAN